MELLSLILILVVAQHNSHLKFAVFIMKCDDALLMDMSESVCFPVKIRLNSSENSD